MKSFRKFLFVFCALLILSGLVCSAEEIISEEGTLKNKSDVFQEKKDEEKPNIKSEGVEANVKPVYYTLLDQSLQPEDTEFYVKSIFRYRGEVKTTIAKSNNARAGDMFNIPLTYGKGDKLTERLIIKDIVLGIGRHLVIQDAVTGNEYVLRLSYGNAISRLIPLVKEPVVNETH